jgi:hypothetical protein
VQPAEAEIHLGSYRQQSLLYLASKTHWLQSSLEESAALDPRHQPTLPEQSLSELSEHTRGQMKRRNSKAQTLHCIGSDISMAWWLSAVFSARQYLRWCGKPDRYRQYIHPSLGQVWCVGKRSLGGQQSRDGFLLIRIVLTVSHSPFSTC